jgi:hypothetical protein
MGAVESSTTQAAGALADTLQQMQQRLSRMEELALHYERQVVDRDCVFVCGKRIRCCARVRLLVGPILGVVQGDTLPVLLEVDTDATIETHVFTVDEATK